MAVSKAIEALKGSLNKGLHSETKRTNMNIVLKLGPEECEYDHVPFPRNLPHFLNVVRAHTKDLSLAKLVEVIVKYYTPRMVEGPVWAN